MSATAPYELQVHARLDEAQVRSVLSVLDEVADHDGVHPLSEHAVLHLRHGGDTTVRHVLAYSRDDELVLAGYLHLDLADGVEGPTAEIAVRPADRGRGLGRRLVERAADEYAPDGRMRLWAHGEQSAARGLAESLGFTRVRTLLQMRRSLLGAIPAPEFADGVRVRTFVPGADDEAWLALNARAFAAHDEQGSWTIEDLRRRVDEPWFDAAGFFLAVRGEGEDERVVGFHWTKVHGGVSVHHHDGRTHVHDGGHGHEPLGEIYVLGVDPAEHGHGLGRALSLVGLRHLRSVGLSAAMLYVEADNTAAVNLYTALGFTRWDTDVMFAREP